jgi:uncharacterized protein (DUF2164 family)
VFTATVASYFFDQGKKDEIRCMEQASERIEKKLDELTRHPSQP